MTERTTFLADNSGYEIGYDVREYYNYNEIIKIHYIEYKGKDLDLGEYEIEDISAILDSFFCIDYGNELAEQFYMKSETILNN